MKRSSALAVFAVLVLAALPAVAAEPVIYAGIDPWVTVPEGTSVDFRHQPLPKGFFCKSSPAFTGAIWFRGVPLASDNPQLARYDTIVERLDDAVFDRRGVARTRFQVKALQLEGISTFKNRCGEYYVQVTLDGVQPVTTMRIIRENDEGGRFVLPVRINTKVIFTRVDDLDEKLEFSYPVTFRPSPYHRWTYSDRLPDAKRLTRATVDTNWDTRPDTSVPGTSNFAPGEGGATRFQTQLKHGGHHTVQQ